jgi:hypothetical protein
MPEFVFAPVSARGSQDPIVARTVLQTRELLNAFAFDSATREAIISVAFGVMRRLTTCADIAEPLIREVHAASGGATNGLLVQSDERVVEIPGVLDLQGKAELFLYSAKLCLTDIAGLFKPLLGQDFDQNFKKAEEWARKELTADAPLRELLSAERPWITRVVEFRNGVEHPKHRAGPLKIRNFQLDGNRLVPPLWWQGNSAPAEIDKDMEDVLLSLLTLFEDLLAVLLAYHAWTVLPIVIAEIPEEQRDPNMPMRLRVVLTQLPSPNQQRT